MVKTVLYLMLAVCLICGTVLIRQRRGGRIGRGKMLTGSVLCGAGLLFALLGIYAETYYHAENVQAALDGGGPVRVQKSDHRYFFDGPGDECAIIFYPGGKVEAAAYAPLLSGLAEQGIDCFLPEMPLRIAFFGRNAATPVLRNHSYDTVIIMGHSLGGIVASGYVADHEDIDGLILLASYPIRKISDRVRLLSIYGDADGVLKRAGYEKARENWPADSTERVIAGGNHAQFGSYGPQKGDGLPAIPAEEQQRETIQTILAWLR